MSPPDIENPQSNASDALSRAAALFQQGKLEDVERLVRSILARHPNHFESLHLLGVCKGQQEKHDEAYALINEALKNNPRSAEALKNRGLALEALNRHQEAIASYQEALDIQPQYAEALFNRGNALKALNRYEEAIASYQQALEINPDYAEAHWNQSLALLTVGDFKSGWEQYEWRMRSADWHPHQLKVDGPVWTGSPLEGQVILVRGEQGLGDQIMFASCLPEIVARAKLTVVEIDARLKKLFSRSFPAARIYTLRSKGIPGWVADNVEIDWQVQIGSLPQRLGRERHNFPKHQGYLVPDPVRVLVWRSRLDRLGPGPKVGISWRGGIPRTRQATRSIPLSQLSPALKTGAHWVSLQYGECQAEIEAFARAEGVTVHHWREAIDDYDETAALVAALDLVVSVQTAIVHLAGALGKAVWVLVPANPEWRYLAHGETLPWYPTARLFRQSGVTDWESVIELVRTELVSNFGRALNEDAPARANFPRSPRLSPPSEDKAPWDSSRMLSRAAASLQQDNFAETEHLLGSILTANPSHFESLHLLGVCKGKQGEYDSAYALINEALKINPQSAEALYNRGNALHALKRHEEAIASYEQAIAIKFDYVEALNNRGNALRALKRQEDAITSYDQALAIKPDFVEALSNRGAALAALNRHEEAIASYDKALTIRPDYAEALNNRGSALQALNRHEEAIASFDKAVALKPDYAEVFFNASLARLTLGDLAAGWQEYEWRWKTKSFASSKRAFRQPLWLGREPLAGKTILLYAEQGFGDTIQFMRYVPLVARKGARVLLAVTPSLAPLVEGLEGIAKVTTQLLPREHFDLQCPLLSLPLAFGTTLETIPAEVPYLHASANKIEHWHRRLGASTRPRVGIVWSGRLTHKNDHNRSIPLSALIPLTEAGVELVSLQKEVRREDQAFLLQPQEIEHFGDELKDFSDSAALVSLMDLVISVDTAAAHLAGALGKPVWILLPFRPDWRWLLDREDSPWYPTARLFRQPDIGDWDSVIRRVVEELREQFPPDDTRKRRTRGAKGKM
ncbi:MAG: tetratricopeptide repeat protein [Methyloceanibacter sp.]